MLTGGCPLVDESMCNWPGPNVGSVTPGGRSEKRPRRAIVTHRDGALLVATRVASFPYMCLDRTVGMAPVKADDGETVVEVGERLSCHVPACLLASPA